MPTGRRIPDMIIDVNPTLGLSDVRGHVNDQVIRVTYHSAHGNLLLLLPYLLQFSSIAFLLAVMLCACRIKAIM